MAIRKVLISLSVSSLVLIAGAAPGALAGGPGGATSPEAPPPGNYAVASTARFVDISAGTIHALGVAADGQVYAWGRNPLGQLGLGFTDSEDTVYTVPTRVPGMTDVVQVKGAAAWSAALTDDGKVYVWGSNTYAQLGQGDTFSRLSPTPVPGLPRIKAIDTTIYHVLALAEDGSVWGWGLNGDNQVNGSGGNVAAPVKLSGLSRVKAVAAGRFHSLALTESGEVWAWGSNVAGLLGLGDAVNRPVPTRVTALAGIPVRDISAGWNYSLAATESGSVYAWGTNSFGQLGINSLQSSVPTPTQAPGLSGVIKVTAGDYTSYAVTANAVYATGRTRDGEIGLGEGRFSGVIDITSFTLNPNLVSTSRPVVKVSARGGYGLALSAQGTIYAWGYVPANDPPPPLGLGTISSTQGTPARVTSLIAPAEFTAAPTPTISGGGTAGVGQTAVLGSWSPQPDSVTYQWLAGGEAIAGAAAATYTPTAAQVGAQLSVKITARALGYHKTSRVSAALPVTAPGPGGQGQDGQGPGKDGQGQDGQGTAAVTAETFAAAPLGITQPPSVAVGRALAIGGVPAGWTATYQWYRNGQPIPGATGPTYTLTAADVGAKVSAIVTVPQLGQSRTTTAITVKVTPKVSVKTKAAARAVVVTVKVGKPAAATGKVKLTLTKTVGKKTVKVKWSGKAAKTVKLTAKAKGKATVKLPKLPPGTYKVTATYAGNAKAAKGSAKAAYKAK